MRLTKRQFRNWVDYVGVANCNNVLFRVKQVYAKALSLNEYTLNAKLAKTWKAEESFDNLTLDQQSDIGVMMMEVIAEEQAKLGVNV